MDDRWIQVWMAIRSWGQKTGETLKEKWMPISDACKGQFTWESENSYKLVI